MTFEALNTITKADAEHTWEAISDVSTCFMLYVLLVCEIVCPSAKMVGI